ncbi:MAG: hypothetical protein GX663_05440 [Clostridiales bacterium]|nr:hypothetical protein [Clostridiales bacterium]
MNLRRRDSEKGEKRMYHYNIIIDGLVCAEFAELSGGELADEAIEFRGEVNRIVQPSPMKHSAITLRRGCSSNKQFIDCILGSNTEAATYKKIEIVLLDGKSNESVGAWELTNIWMLKCEVAKLETGVDKAEFEWIKLACESMKRIQFRGFR